MWNLFECNELRFWVSQSLGKPTMGRAYAEVCAKCLFQFKIVKAKKGIMWDLITTAKSLFLVQYSDKPLSVNSNQENKSGLVSDYFDKKLKKNQSN